MFGLDGFLSEILIFPLDMLIFNLEQFHNGRRLPFGLAGICFSFMLSDLIELFFEWVDSVSVLFVERIVSHHERGLDGMELFHFVVVG